MRKHLGLMPPAPVQAAMIAALGDDAHVAEQRERYRARRETHAAPPSRRRGSASTRARRGCTSGRPEGEDCLGDRRRRSPTSASWSRPGTSTATAGAQHVRVALTATDADVAEAARRLEQFSKR